MLNLTKEDAKRYKEMIYWLLENESKMTIDSMLKKFDLTFDEYRIVCDLAIPALASQNESRQMRAKATSIKMHYDKVKHQKKEAESILKEALNWITCYENPDVIVSETPEEMLTKAREKIEEYFKPRNYGPVIIKREDQNENDEVLDQDYSEIEGNEDEGIDEAV